MAQKDIDAVRASRAGHVFHERWTARRALQLIFPKDRLYAIAVEGLSTTESATPGDSAEDVADLVLYYGDGHNFRSCEKLETVQFEYKANETPVSASYLKKTIEKFSDTLVGYEREFSQKEIDAKLSFSFVTNADFSPDLWEAIKSLKVGKVLSDENEGAASLRYLSGLCKTHGVDDASRLFSRIEFRAAEKNLPAQDKLLRRTLTDWSAGADGPARIRLLGLQDLVIKKAGLAGQRNNLLKREDVLDALECEPEDLFPADTRFIPVGDIVEREAIAKAADLITTSALPFFIHAEGGVGKTVFVQSLAASLTADFEVVVFDCFGGGAYRSEDQARHLPKVGLVQIANELASRGLCDPLLPGDSERTSLLKAAKKRFAQAAMTVRTQSAKHGILIVVDAADNAQVEAEHRKEEAFPSQLLASINENPIDGVKLVLTARTHRMAKVVGRTKVLPFELEPFFEAEARLYLEGRREKISAVEYATAIARSGRNARVLAYLVDTWDTNVVGITTPTLISVEEIIAQKCEKIFDDLRIAGWIDAEIREFFAAISLLPPPIPLDELASALGWSRSQVASAASDLAPMLEIVPHGAIFRDEPTETYVSETYSRETAAQQAIAQRLEASQSRSAYAAEALPHFLVVINDSDRAYKLADSKEFPKSMQSDFGRRRLTLARLYAAFRLAVTAADKDRVLGLVMRLAQVAAANARGDQFIRRSPSLATILGDRDSYRRLFNDRSGWRGARSARLTIAHCFAGEAEEAQIQRERTIRWLNGYAEQPREEGQADSPSPGMSDLVAILFQDLLQGEYETIDRNLCRWKLQFSLSVCHELLMLARQYERFNNKTVLQKLIEFASSPQCNSFALRAALLSGHIALDDKQAKVIIRAASAASAEPKQNAEEVRYDPEKTVDGDIVRAAFAALLLGTRKSATRMLTTVRDVRPTCYEYGDRYGHSRVWMSVLRACIGAWADGRHVAFHDLLPREVKITRKVKAITDPKELRTFLKQLESSRPAAPVGKRNKPKSKAQFNDRECQDISSAIELILALIEPIQTAVLSKRRVSAADLSLFLSKWRVRLRTDLSRRIEEPTDLLSRAIGLEFSALLLKNADDVDLAEGKLLLELIASDQFAIDQKTRILALMAERQPLHGFAGSFARHITEQIGKDEYVEQRGKSYAELSAALVPMSLDEAREYDRQGLSQLDQMGGDDYDQIYALLRYAAEQSGGVVRLDLGHRLMNLCQTISHHEPSKFGWTLFGRAAASSIGFSAMNKLVRWDDQDVADFSYGLPQLACFLAKKGALDPRRAAFLVSICEDHGWYDWQAGDGLADLLEVATPGDRIPIFRIIFSKLKAEHPFGAWPSLWEGLLTLAEKFPDVVTEENKKELRILTEDARRERDEYNSRNSSSDIGITPSKSDTVAADSDDVIARLVRNCDPTSALSLDDALRRISADQSLAHGTRRTFMHALRAQCPYDKRLGFMLAVCEASEFQFDDATDLLVDCLAQWRESSAALVANAGMVVQRLFEFKGSGLFELTYGSIAEYIKLLSDFCGDAPFVLDLVLQTVAFEQLDLGGDEWLQLATSLSGHASSRACVDALETLLSGPAAKMADAIGEGPFRQEFAVGDDQPKFIASIAWHLLGDDDAYVRWGIARGLKTLADLGLVDDLSVLLDSFDQTEVAALVSPPSKLSFQNSQQWLLMGLARASLYHPRIMDSLRPRMLSLARRTDIHVVHKLHIARYLENVLANAAEDPDLNTLRTKIGNPSLGYVVSDGWPVPAPAQSGFSFDYEFNKSEVEGLARLFGLSGGQATDAIAAEIVKRWPQATSMGDFPGVNRYRRDSDDRYEFYREHVQKHALISAATTLARSLPVIRRSYDADERTPWAEWLNDFDITFDDGSWLSDRKDTVPNAAKATYLGPRVNKVQTFQDRELVLQKIGLIGQSDNSLVPIYASWTAPDGVYVSLVSALVEQKGAVGACEKLSKRNGHDLWLPQFWDGGYYDKRYHQSSVFEPLLWVPDRYGLGIDQGDQIAARGPAGRPRLGIELTVELGLITDRFSGKWRTEGGDLALRSQVWGEWKPDSDQPRNHAHNDGEFLLADPKWLDDMQAALGRCLVYSITLWKYRSSRDYEEGGGAKTVIVALRRAGKDLRIWDAKKASVYPA